MALARYGNQRDANEPDIVAALEKIGASVVRLDTPADLLVGFRGRTYLLEVKLPPGPRGGMSHSTLTPDQVTFQRTWKGQYNVVRCTDDTFEAIHAFVRGGSGQSRLGSTVEAVVNVSVGYVVAIAAQMHLFPLFGFDITLASSVSVGGFLLVLAILRSYLMRRAFNWLHRRFG